MRRVFVDTSAFVALRNRREEEAWSILETHEAKEWSYVDATSFALMRREGAREAFAFDRHFAQRGLLLIPR